MEKIHLDFIADILKRFATAYNTYRNNDCNIELEHHPGKDYWTINCKFQYCNSKYEDCVVFYLDKDSFDAEKILEDFDEILRKGKLILGR